MPTTKKVPWTVVTSHGVEMDYHHTVAQDSITAAFQVGRKYRDDSRVFKLLVFIGEHYSATEEEA